jgi:hypothetical protein
MGWLVQGDFGWLAAAFWLARCRLGWLAAAWQ